MASFIHVGIVFNGIELNGPNSTILFHMFQYDSMVNSNRRAFKWRCSSFEISNRRCSHLLICEQWGRPENVIMMLAVLLEVSGGHLPKQKEGKVPLVEPAVGNVCLLGGCHGSVPAATVCGDQLQWAVASLSPRTALPPSIATTTSNSSSGRHWPRPVSEASVGGQCPLFTQKIALISQIVWFLNRICSFFHALSDNNGD